MLMKTADWGLQLLEMVFEHPEGLSLAQMARELKRDKASVHRMVNTLERRGYIVRDPVSRASFPGPKVFELAGSFGQAKNMRSVANKYLCRLARGSGETAHLAVLVGTQAVLVDHMLSPGPVGVITHSGGIAPLHATAVGKALIMDMSQAALQRLLEEYQFERYTPLTHRSLTALRRDLALARERGYTTDMGECVPGIRCVAAPVRDATGRTVASIGLSGPAERLTERRIQELGALVAAVAQEMSAELGFKPE